MFVLSVAGVSTKPWRSQFRHHSKKAACSMLRSIFSSLPDLSLQ